MTPIQLLDQLVTEGGAIVSSGDCSEMEIANAKATGRFAVREDALGFVRRTKEWLALQLAREKLHPNTDGKYGNAIGDGFYRTTASGAFGSSEWLDLLLAVQDGRCICMKAKEIIEREIDARLENPPKHDYWMAGDPQCPKEIKAGNGELHTLRCKKCGKDSPRSPICRELNPENAKSAATGSQEDDHE